MDIRKTLSKYTDEPLNDLNKAIKTIYEQNKLKTFDADRKNGFIFCCQQIEKKCEPIEENQKPRFHKERKTVKNEPFENSL